jgi:NhaA family Na+:H+ antiporter
VQRGGSFFQRFFRTETVGGIILLVFAIAALILANSAWAPLYTAFWEARVSIGMGDRTFTLSLHQWINDGLMAIFFLLVGLEIKRELLAGELASVKQAALPIAAALGGMVVPAALYWSLNPSGASAAGWGIPMATDIAFALGALALIAPHAPLGIKVFLAALAIVDDMGAVVVIAVFYSGEIAWVALAAAGGMIGVLIALNLAGVIKLWPYLICGIVLWYFVHESGVHATIAGVALAMIIPSRTRLNAVEFSREARALLDQFDRTETGDLLVLTSKGQQESLFALDRASEGAAAPILRLEHGLHSFSAFVVMPLFAFANAGVQIGGPMAHHGIALGVIAGLVIGKPLGILGACLLAVKSGFAKLPDEVNWGSLFGAACLAGIGFTMSLFIAMLAFDSAALINTAKVAILGASLLAGVTATVVLNAFGRVGGKPRA